MSISIPGSVSSLSASVFSGCNKLYNVTIEDGVNVINTNAFRDCIGLKTINIPKTVSLIEVNSFYDCTNLESINIDKDNPTYKSNEGVVLSKNGTVLIMGPPGKNYNNYTIPNTVKTIGYNAFRGCDKMTSINIPEGVETINGMAFSECNSLTTVTIPSTVTYIVAGLFCMCSNLKSIKVDSGNDKYSSNDGVLFNKAQTSLHQFPCGKNSDGYIIPNTVTSIGTNAFRGCHKLTNVTISTKITNIWSFAFMDTGLKTVTIPLSVTFIGNSPFADCVNLTSIKVSPNNNNFTSIDGVLFDKKNTTLIQYPAGKNGDHYSIPDSVRKINYLSFGSCNLKSITIPKSVKSIESYAFNGCQNLESVTYLGTSNPLNGTNFFYNCDSFEFICIPKDYTNTSFCGRTDIAYSDDCTELIEKENECYEVIPVNKTWVLQPKGEALLWINQSDNCVEYECYNESGNIARNKCDKNFLCMESGCVNKDEMYEGNVYVVIIQIDVSNIIFIDLNGINEIIVNISEVDIDKKQIAVEYNDDGTLSEIILFVDDESTARKIEKSISDEETSVPLLRNATVRVEVNERELSVVSLSRRYFTQNNLLLSLLFQLFLSIFLHFTLF